MRRGGKRSWVGVAFAGFSLGGPAQKRVSRGAGSESGDFGDRSTHLLPQPMMPLNFNMAIDIAQTFYSIPTTAASMRANAMCRVCKGRRISCGSAPTAFRGR
jgi:hypothetical protein